VGAVRPEPPSLRAPEHLTPQRRVAEFASGNAELDRWLKDRALANEVTGASRTYVVCAADRVIGYYALATGGIGHTRAPGRVRRNMPDPLPVMIIGRLAVDHAWQRQGIGTALLRDAVARIVQAAEIAGIRAIVVNAIDEEAKRFYLRHGFGVSPTDALQLIITVSDAARAMAG
jgi:predicted N-acetyltransferase YhbS